jgi:hypothetical protein
MNDYCSHARLTGETPRGCCVSGNAKLISPTSIVLLVSFFAVSSFGCYARPGRIESRPAPAGKSSSTAGACKAGAEFDNDRMITPAEPLSLSITDLLAHPARYHGQRVTVEGVLHLRFELSAIYPSDEHGGDGLWVSFSGPSDRFASPIGPTNLDTKRVRIEGVFDMNDHGHMGDWPGAITGVEHIYELRGHGKAGELKGTGAYTGEDRKSR